jgi:hypothetical protein
MAAPIAPSLVKVFDGPVPAGDDLVELIVAKLPLAPRYRLAWYR